ncbi:MAG: hypothetical protein KAX45_11305 [Chitinophagaceae bacterium]|nr:hypothetical protein [Chitinophagaceae bacterium]MBP8245121.1 hypothetical protein [Chitinophagaceae bacterium]
MKKTGFVIVLVCMQVLLFAQFGSVAVFENGADQKVKKVRIFPVKCTVNSMHDSAYRNVIRSVNNFMNLDGSIVSTKFYIPFTAFEGAKKFAIDEYIGKKEAKKVLFVNESEELLLDYSGNVVSSNIQQRPIGVMVIYYADFSKTNNGLAINSAYGYTIYGKPGFNEMDLATKLAAKVLGSTKFTYEWLPGKTMEYAKGKVEKAITFRDNGDYRVN